MSGLYKDKVFTSFRDDSNYNMIACHPEKAEALGETKGAAKDLWAYF